MNQGKYVFAQITEFLPQRAFDTCVEKHEGNRYIKHFTCWNQLLCMMFGQIANIESLSSLILCIESHKPKAYHLGFGTGISKNNLAKANEHRSWLIFAEYASIIIQKARQYSIDDFGINIK